MTSKITQAVDHLNSVLPLKANQQSCSAELKQLHQTILRTFVEQGRLLTLNDCSLSVEDFQKALIALQKKDLIVLDNENQLVGAYPLTDEPREHKVHVNGFDLYAMCALDALSVSSLFNVDCIIHSICRVTQSNIHIKKHSGQVANINEVSDIHIGIAWSAASTDSCCANNLCLQMIFLIDSPTASHWLGEDKENREIFTLTEAIEFGALFFNPLLEN